MVTTRAGTSREKTSTSHMSKKEQLVSEDEYSEGHDFLEKYKGLLQDHIQDVQKGVEYLTGTIEGLQRSNKRLRQGRENARNTPQITGPSVIESEDDMNLAQIKIKNLQKKVQRMQTANRRQEKEMHKLKEKLELMQDIKELQSSEEELEVKESESQSDESSMTTEVIEDKRRRLNMEHEMRKLLRQFSRLMTVSILSEDNNNCTDCGEALHKKQCSSLDCEHILCDGCLAMVSWMGSSQVINCPKCNCPTSHDDLESIDMDARDRWDALHNVAQEWDKLDSSDVESECTDESEKNVDSSKMSDSSDSPPRYYTPVRSMIDEQLSTDELDDSNDAKLSYWNSPTKEKRKRLEQLWEEKLAQKRRRRGSQ